MTIAGFAARAVAKLNSGQAGVAGIGTVFLLAALVAGGATFGYAASHQNTLAALRFNAVAQQALDNTGRVVIVQGPLYVNDVNVDGAIDSSDTITLDVSLAPGSTPVDRTTMAMFLSTNRQRGAVSPTIDGIVGDADGLLEPGEIAELTFAPPQVLTANDALTIELTPSGGATTTVESTMPPAIDGLMTLR